MKSYILVGTVFFILCIASAWSASGMPRCRPCADGQCPEPENCLYGIVTNYCGRRICAKGPGDICGQGMFSIYGKCGDGLFCRCGRCIGCSLNTLKCYDKTCV